MDDEMIGRMLGGEPPSQDESTPRRLWYGAQDIARAFDLWERGRINVNAQRPWRDAYQAAVRRVLPALSRYKDVGELVEAYYGAALYADVERASQLGDGRILDRRVVEDAAYMARYRAITPPVPAIAWVNVYIMNTEQPGEEHLRDLLEGSVSMGPDGHLVYDPPGDAGVEELVEELRYDYAFGREWRRLTDAELLAHMPLRPMGYTWAEAFDADGNLVDVSGIRP